LQHRLVQADMLASLGQFNAGIAKAPDLFDRANTWHRSGYPPFYPPSAGHLSK
jgi:hypothetical protein